MNYLIKWILTVVTIVLLLVVVILGALGYGIFLFLGGWQPILDILLAIVILWIVWQD